MESDSQAGKPHLVLLTLPSATEEVHILFTFGWTSSGHQSRSVRCIGKKVCYGDFLEHNRIGPQEFLQKKIGIEYFNQATVSLFVSKPAPHHTVSPGKQLMERTYTYSFLKAWSKETEGKRRR
jgi:hypothetical protein